MGDFNSIGKIAFYLELFCKESRVSEKCLQKNPFTFRNMIPILSMKAITNVFLESPCILTNVLCNFN